MRQREKAGIRRAKLIKSIQGEKKRSNALIKKQMIYFLCFLSILSKLPWQKFQQVL